MLSVASLLNPVKSELRDARLPPSPSPSLGTSSSTHGSPHLSIQSSSKKQKMSKDGAVFAKGKIKGEINYPPFESLDKATMDEVEKFHVYPIGKIEEYSRHIPYNSEKKSFLEKTGRESFEVFQYIFKVPGDDKDYTVMWDYNIGLVRVTPFFKCCKYSKTTPAKMLNMNPGLKEITHSITGGALAAQGYWMPYSCALAVCATFCTHIAGALIPIFGPSFPSQCVPPEAPEYGRMIIDPSLVTSATSEAENYRIQYTNNPPSFSPISSGSTRGRESYSPTSHAAGHESFLNIRTTPNTLGRRLRLKRTFGGDSQSPYGTTPTDTDIDTNGSETSSGDGYFCSPATPISANSLPNQGLIGTWRQTHNHNHNENMISYSTNSSINISSSHKILPGTNPNPLLSAIPRSAVSVRSLVDVQMGGTTNWATNANTISAKRRVEEVDADDEYDGEESIDDKGSENDSTTIHNPVRIHHQNNCSFHREIKDVSTNASFSAVSGGNPAFGGAEKKAAWLLMKLSVNDGECGVEMTREKGLLSPPTGPTIGVVFDGPRIKRRRATSM